MIRLFWPDRILSRTALVLVGAVAVALVVAALWFISQSHQALSALGGRNAAERVAAMVDLVEDTPSLERRPIIRRMESTGFRVGWGLSAAVEQPEFQSRLTSDVRAMLNSTLDGRKVLIDVAEPVKPKDHGAELVLHPHPMHPPEVRNSFSGPGFRNVPVSVPLLRISVQLRDDSWLNVMTPLEPYEGPGRLRLLLQVLPILLIVVLLALLMVRHATRPVAELGKAAKRLGLDVNAPPLDETGPLEVRQAAQAFNEMQERIKRFVDDRTQMLAAISHDLRTPITRLRLRAEFIDDDIQRAKVLDDLDEMEKMIAATLAFARDDASREEQKLVDVAVLTQDLAEDLGLTYQGPDHLVQMIRPIGLKRALGNVMVNAMKYGFEAKVSLSQRRTAHNELETLIEVSDKGPGIPEDQFEKVFQPFYRLESSRNRETGGTGLGLSTARAVIRAHGGDIVLSNQGAAAKAAIGINSDIATAEGLVVRMTLPVQLPNG